MESAINKYTGDIVDAEQLWELDFVNQQGYICRGCGIQVTPCSYRPENKKRPYFSAKAGHHPDCDIEGEIEIIKKAKTQSVATPDGFPVSFPNRLVLKDTRQVVPPTDSSPTNEAKRSQGSKSTENDSAKRNRTWTAQTIRPICRTFLNYPYDRDLPLSISDIDGKTYREIFWRLGNKGIKEYGRPRIFYAPISWHKVKQTEDFFEIQTSDGLWQDKKLIQPYLIRVNWKDWSSAKRRSISNEIEIAISESIKAKGSNKKGWLFFIGTQNQENPEVFDVTDHRLICCLVGEMIY